MRPPLTPSRAWTTEVECQTPAHSTNPNSCSTGPALWEFSRKSAVRTTGKKALAYRGKGGQNTDTASHALRLGVVLYLPNLPFGCNEILVLAAMQFFIFWGDHHQVFIMHTYLRREKRTQRIFLVGWGSSTWRGGGQKVRYVPRNPGNQTCLAGYPGKIGSTRKVWEKNVWVQFLSPTVCLLKQVIWHWSPFRLLTRIWGEFISVMGPCVRMHWANHDHGAEKLQYLYNPGGVQKLL